MGVVQAIEGYNATCGADSEIGRIVDESADLDEVVEDGGVDWAGAGGVVVDVDEGLEDLVGKLQPWPVEGRDVTPVSVVSVDQQLCLAHREWWGGQGGAAQTEGSFVPSRTPRARCDVSSATGKCDNEQREGTTDLLRHIMRAGEAGGWGSAGATALDFELEAVTRLEPALALVLLVLVLVVVTASFLEAGPGPSSPGPRGATTPPLGSPLPPSGASFLCLFFFLAILKSDGSRSKSSGAQAASRITGEESVPGA